MGQNSNALAYQLNVSGKLVIRMLSIQH